MATLMQDTVHEHRAISCQVEAAGRELARYGLVVVVAWIGLMKFTTCRSSVGGGATMSLPATLASISTVNRSW